MNINSISHSGKGNHARFMVNFANDEDCMPSLTKYFLTLGVLKITHPTIYLVRGMENAWNQGDFYAVFSGNTLTMFVHPTKARYQMTTKEWEQYEQSLDICSQAFTHFYLIFSKEK